MHGHTVTLSEPGNQERQHTYPRWEVAACVFEANVHALVRDGFALVETSCGSDALGFFSPPEAGELYTARRGATGIESVSIDAADPVAIHDGTGAWLHRAHELGRFDRSVIDPAWEIDHVLRRAVHWPGASSLRGFELIVAFEHQRFLNWVRRDSVRTLLSHLQLFGPWSRPELTGLARTFPNLRGLSLPRPWLMATGPSELAELQYLQLDGREGDIDKCLGFAFDHAPGLLALSVTVSDRELESVLQHRILGRLYELLVRVEGPLDTALLPGENRYPHLERLHLEAPQLDEDQRARLERLPPVCLADHRPTGACWQTLRRRYGP